MINCPDFDVLAYLESKEYIGSAHQAYMYNYTGPSVARKMFQLIDDHRCQYNDATDKHSCEEHWPMIE